MSVLLPPTERDSGFERHHQEQRRTLLHLGTRGRIARPTSNVLRTSRAKFYNCVTGPKYSWFLGTLKKELGGRND